VRLSSSGIEGQETGFKKLQTMLQNTPLVQVLQLGAALPTEPFERLVGALVLMIVDSLS